MKAYHYSAYSDDPDVFSQSYYVLDNLKETPSGTVRADMVLIVGVHNSGALVLASKSGNQYVTEIIKNSSPREIGQGVKSSMINLIFTSTSIARIDL